MGFLLKSRLWNDWERNNLLLTEREGRTGEYWPEVEAVQKRPRANINLLLTEREGRTREYWPEVVTVRTERSEVRT